MSDLVTEGHMIHIIVRLKPSADSLCPVREHLHLCFFCNLFSFLYLVTCLVYSDEVSEMTLSQLMAGLLGFVIKGCPHVSLIIF